ncbi:MAG: hypothetical protein JST01_06315 [Cyanobacteria bacterium SZAS TMP-1]|nr:hypothetical protein [Cyanobacteria bacterium SZAS TMP-1]
MTNDHHGERVLGGKESAWKADLAPLLPSMAPCEKPLQYRQELSNSVHEYLRHDKNFVALNERLHREHVLKAGTKVVGVSVHNGLPELVLVDSHKEVLAVSVESGQTTGSFSRDARGGLYHSQYLARPRDLLPLPLADGATIWRDRHGQGRISEIETAGGLKECISYRPDGSIQKLDLFAAGRPLFTYQRNERGGYDAIGSHGKFIAGQLDAIKLTDDGSAGTGRLTLSFNGGRSLKFMGTDGRVERLDF